MERQCSGLSGTAQAHRVGFTARSGIDTSYGDGSFGDSAVAQITPADQSTPRSIMLQSLIAALQSSGMLFSALVRDQLCCGSVCGLEVCQLCAKQARLHSTTVPMPCWLPASEPMPSSSRSLPDWAWRGRSAALSCMAL